MAEQRAKKQLYYQQNKERIRARHSEYYERNKEQLKADSKAYYQEHRDHAIERVQDYYQQHRDHIKSRGREYYYARDPLDQEIYNIRSAIHYCQTSPLRKIKVMQYYYTHHDEVLARQAARRNNNNLNVSSDIRNNKIIDTDGTTNRHDGSGAGGAGQIPTECLGASGPISTLVQPEQGDCEPEEKAILCGES